MFFRTARRNIDYVVDCLADSPLKTQVSTRHISLIGVSLWAAKRVCLNRSSGYCFPGYNAQDKTSSISARFILNQYGD